MQFDQQRFPAFIFHFLFSILLLLLKPIRAPGVVFVPYLLGSLTCLRRSFLCYSSSLLHGEIWPHLARNHSIHFAAAIRKNHRDDLPMLLLILASFLAGIAASWERWGNPLIDAGRELNVPLRLARGDMLYSQVRYIYGPLSPYVNAALFRIFHPSLWVIWTRGIVTTIFVLAIVYWLARQITGRRPATLACLAVTWLCALKPEGNYVLPYAYSGLDGCLFGLGTLALCIVGLRKRSSSAGASFALAGVAASLAFLAKTEMGFAAIAIGVMAVVLAGFPDWRRLIAQMLAFLVPALGITAVVMEWFAIRVGWTTLTTDSYFFFGHVPWQLIHFNQVRFGFDHPWHSLGLMILSVLRLAAIAGLLAAICLLWSQRTRDASRSGSPTRSSRQLYALLLLSLAAIGITSPALSDLGPFMAMPFILIALVIAALVALRVNYTPSVSADASNARVFLLIAVFALGSLARIFLRVSSGGALSSFLVPLSIVLFVCVWLDLFPLFLKDPSARQLARKAASAVLTLSLLVSAVVLSVRYQRKFSYPIVTERGTWRTSPELGIAFNQALRYIDANTKPGGPVAPMPEGTSINFLSGRPNPLRDEISLPGMVTLREEESAIRTLQNLSVPLVLIVNRSTAEFGQAAFGVDYETTLVSWIEKNYSVCAIFTAHPNLQKGAHARIGNPFFFIRAYCKK